MLSFYHGIFFVNASQSGASIRNSRSGLFFLYNSMLAFIEGIFFVNASHTCGEPFVHRRFFFFKNG